ncbi:GNAT family N-acetyltransferase [Streptacidiphilus sp. EB129]|uniref:GNAT family N-acetyltransferase n=1 Tax=Streptacidiphilus sp. EB129 TaxID=3156262 RepID=UPI003519ACD1
MVSRIRVAETERLVLTRPQPDDAEAVFAVHGDPETNRYNPHGPMRSVEMGREWLRLWDEDWATEGIGYCAVALRGDPGAVIGFAGTKVVLLEGERVLNLYYRFSPSVWGRGLAREAAQAGLDLGRPRFPELRVVALIRPDNLPSLRLAERLGFTPSEGKLDGEGRLIHSLPQSA